MMHIYYLITIILTGLVSSLMTMYLPSFKRVFKRVLQRTKRKSTKYSLEEFDARISNLEAKHANRESNMQRKIKAEVENQLKQIIND